MLAAPVLAGCMPAVLDIGPPASLAYVEVDRLEVGGAPLRGREGARTPDGGATVLVPTEEGFEVLWLSLDAGGGLEAPSPVADVVDPTDLVVADFDADGAQEFAVASNLSEITLYDAMGPAQFVEGVTVSDPRRRWVHLARIDVNGDAAPDLLAASPYQDTALDVWENEGHGSLDGPFEQPEVEGGCLAPTVDDVDGDGWDDVMCGARTDVGLTVLRGRGSPVLGRPGRVRADIRVQSTAVGDFDGDGTVQIAMAGAPSDTQAPNELWLARPRGRRFAASFALAFPATEIVAADLDGDGDDDLVAACEDGPVAVLESLGGGFWARPVWLLSHVHREAFPTVVDIDGEGPLDIVVVDQGSGEVTTFLGQAL